MALMKPLLLLLAALAVTAAAEDLYCGDSTCYEVLEVESTASVKEIADAYKRLARRYHPDKNKNSKESHEAMVKVNRAYEVLQEQESRDGYDYYLRNPDASMYNLSRYYQYRYGLSDWRYVLSVTIAIWTAIQYTGQYFKYREAVDYFKKQPKVTRIAKAMAQERFQEKVNEGGKMGNKAEVKAALAALEAEATEELAAEMNIEGGYAKPTWRSLFAVQLVFLPVVIAKWLWWNVRWFVKFNLLGHPFGPEENVYRTRAALGLSQSQWDYFGEEERENLLAKELWEPENFTTYQKEKLTEKTGELSGRQKQYLRFRKRYKPNLGAPE